LGALAQANPMTNEILPILDWFRNAMRREAQHHEPAPMLDALMPIVEYSYEQLNAAGLSDSFLTAGIRAQGIIQRAAAELRPLGIFESDLCLLLQQRMQEQLKLQKEKARKQRRRRK
jgi:hypothetical protein